MSLLTRLVAPLDGETKLPVHQFTAELAEVWRGEITKAKMVADFNLTPEEETTLDAMIAAIGANTFTRQEFHDVMMMGESGFYTPAEITTRLLG